MEETHRARSLGVLRNSLCKHGHWAQRGTTAHIRMRSDAKRPCGKIDEAHGAPETYHARARGAPLLVLYAGRSSGCMRTELRARSLMWTKDGKTYPGSAKQRQKKKGASKKHMQIDVLRTPHSNTKARRYRAERGCGGVESSKEETRTYRMKRLPIVCCAASSASSGSAPTGVRLERIDSRVSGAPRELSNVPARAASLFDAMICCNSASIASAGEGCACCCCCCCCWAAGAGAICWPVAVGAASATGSVVCEPEAAAATPTPDADVEGGVGKGLSVVILDFSFSFCSRKNMGTGSGPFLF